MRRRGLLKVAVGGTTLLGLLGVDLFWAERSIGPAGALSSDATEIFRSVASVVLDRSLALNPAARAIQLDEHVARLQLLLAALPPATQMDISLMLSVLASTSGRYALAQLSSPWSKATTDEAGAALQLMRTSSLAVRQQAYHALRDLTNAAFYAEPSAWGLMGYPGPSDI